MKKPVNPEDVKELNIDCADCNKPLLKMICVRNTDKIQKVIVNCPYCEGQSWMNDLVGDYFQAPPEGLQLGEVEENEGMFKLTMELTNA